MMAVREHEQIEQLAAFWAALERDPAAVPPVGLDVDLAQTAQRLVNQLRPPEPGAAFVSQLHCQLQAQAAGTPREAGPARAHRSGWWQRLGQLVRSPGLVRLAAAVAVVAALVGGSFAIARPQPVSAQEIIQKAQAAAAWPVAGGVQSYVLTELWRAWPGEARLNAHAGRAGDEEIISESQWWYQAPNHWRNEGQERVLRPDGTEVRRSRSLLVGDGQDLWLYYPDANQVTVNRLSPGLNGKGDMSPFGQGVGDLDALLRQAGTCYDPRVTGSASVAGRPAYVVELGPTRCPSASAPEANGRRVIWVDKETFFVLKQEQYSTEGDRLILRSEVTSVQYNVPVDEALFAFTPPAGASVLDGRPQGLATLPPPTPVPGSSPAPGPTADPQQAALLAALEPLAREAGYPLFVPERIPAGLVPRLPRLQPDEGSGRQLWLEYVPAGEVEQDTLATLRIVEQRATYRSVIEWTQGAIPIAVDTGKAWARRGFRDAGGGGSDSVALVLRDGTLLNISSSALPAEDLLEMASSLQTVPGSHAPLAEPQPPTVADLRAQASYPIFVPTWVPEGLMPEPPVGYRIDYYDASGGLGLRVLNGTGLADDPRKAGELVALPNGLTAHWLELPAHSGGPILWWIQEGMPLAVTGPNLTQEELVRVAASMSKTADLGPTRPQPQPTPALVLPAPTPMPTPTFRVLRPTWLPEPMAVREQVDGDIVTLGFDPQPDGGMHDVLTLREVPLRIISRGGSDDPQASQEQIGDYTVTVIRRGQGCVTYTWEAGGLCLTLGNVYDPQGQLKYTCEQMRKIVESVR